MFDDTSGNSVIGVIKCYEIWSNYFLSINLNNGTDSINATLCNSVNNIALFSVVVFPLWIDSPNFCAQPDGTQIWLRQGCELWNLRLEPMPIFKPVHFDRKKKHPFGGLFLGGGGKPIFQIFGCLHGKPLKLFFAKNFELLQKKWTKCTNIFEVNWVPMLREKATHALEWHIAVYASTSPFRSVDWKFYLSVNIKSPTLHY